MDIAVVGAGIAGLSAALKLKEHGHRVTVFEVNSRLGGRMYTHHFRSLDANDGPVFFEAGAMRIPLSTFHTCVFDFIRHLNAQVPEHKAIQLLPFVLQHPNNFLLINGQWRKCDDSNLSTVAGLAPRHHGRTAREILTDVLRPWNSLITSDPGRALQEILRYDDMSFRAYLRNIALLEHETIDFIETIMSQTNQYDLSFLDMVIQSYHFATPEWATVKGGMSRIIDVTANLIGQENILRNAQVTEIEELSGKIAVRTNNPSQPRVFDKVLLALSPAAIQKIHSRPTWSPLKEQAIRGIHEGPLYKMGLHFRRRFWEQVEYPSFGGQGQTDLRIRWVVFPSQDLGSSGSGCLVTYCGMTDAQRWAWMPFAERVKIALEDLDQVWRPQGVDVYSEYIEAHDAPWPAENAYGNTMYLPGQFTRFHEAMKQPEGNIHFAGEHCSVHHTWIAGAVETAQAAVDEMLGLAPRSTVGMPVGCKPVEQGWHVASGITVERPPLLRRPSENLVKDVDSGCSTPDSAIVILDV